MEQQVCEHIHPGIITMQAMLRKIDRLRLPLASRRDVESILVRQVSKELDRTLPCRAGHGRRTAAISVLIGQAIGLTHGELHDLKLAALLHDVGLLMLPIHLVESRDSLRPEAYVAIQNHSRLGATLLKPFSFLRKASILIAHHHERWDGSGYPYGIRGECIPLGARILSIADAFDAIQVPDVPCPDTRNKIALRILLVASGTQFDPTLVPVLCRLLGQSDASSQVGQLTERVFCFDRHCTGSTAGAGHTGPTHLNVKCDSIRHIEIAATQDHELPMLTVTLTSGKAAEFPLGIAGRLRGQSECGEIEFPVSAIKKIVFKSLHARGLRKER